MNHYKKNIYYGIIFLFLYRMIFQISEKLVSSMILSIGGNIYVAFSLLCILSLVMIFVFICIKQFPRMNIAFICLIVFLLLALTGLNMPTRFLISEKEFYSTKEQGMFITLSGVAYAFNYWSMVIIACIRYFRMQKKEEGKEQSVENQKT